MSKFAVRITIIGVAIYLVLCYILSVVCNVDIWSDAYKLLFELCVCLCISKQGVYHCRFIKYTAYGILASDMLVCADNIFDMMPTNFLVLIPPTVIAFGLSASTTLAIRHFIQVKRLKRLWNNR